MKAQKMYCEGHFCSDIVPLLRIDHDNPHLLRKAFEAGAGGVIVPHIRTQQEAQAIVQATKFPPIGKRGYGGQCFSAKWGIKAGIEWMELWNKETLVIPMAEDIEALVNIDSIMATEGVDAIFSVQRILVFLREDFLMLIMLRTFANWQR